MPVRSLKTFRKKHSISGIINLPRKIAFLNKNCFKENAKLDPIDMFKKCTRAYFFGSLRPPFATESRNKAGLTEDFYLDLSEPRLADDTQQYLGTEDMG